jgi:tetratricopeptide (TPR) repeat protein
MYAMKIRQIVTILAILVMVAVCIQPVAAETEDAATNYYNIAQQYIAQGQYERAVEYFDKALASNTTLLGMGDGLMYTYKDKSAALTDLGRYDEAITTADAGIAKFPKSAGMWNNKGYAYFKMGKFGEAADAYGKAVQIDPTYLKGWINRGDASMKAGRAGDAVTAYTKALELDPGNADATAGLAEAKKTADTFNLIIAAILIVAAALVIWYVKFRSAGDAGTSQPAEGKKKGKTKE